MTDIVRADGHLWLKYGQKNIHNTSIIRCYYKCYSSKNKPPCRAKKTVDYDRRLPISSSTTQTNAVVTNHNSLASPSNSAAAQPEPSTPARSGVSKGELPIGPASSGGIVSSAVEADRAESVSLSRGAAAAIVENLLPQSDALTGSRELAALTPPPRAIPSSPPFNSCESATESGNLSHFFAENDSLGGRWPYAEKRVRLTPSDEAASTEDTRNSAGYHWLPSSRVFETLSADLDQMLYPEPCSPPTADAAADDVSFGLPLTGVSFEDGHVAASPEEARPRGLVHADISFEDFLSELTPELCSESFRCEEPPWLEAADVSPSRRASGWSDGSSSDDSQEPHRIHLNRIASAMLPGTTEAGILDGSNPGHACVPWPMSKSSSAHSVFSFLGGGDTLSVSDLMKHLYRPWTQSSRPRPLKQPPLVQPPLDPRAAAPGSRAATPGSCSSRPWCSRPWTLEQPPLDPEQPSLAPAAATPDAAAPGLRAAAPGPATPPLDPVQPPLDPETRLHSVQPPLPHLAPAFVRRPCRRPPSAGPARPASACSSRHCLPACLPACRACPARAATAATSVTTARLLLLLLLLLAVARCSSSGVHASLSRPSSFVSGTLRVEGLGVPFAARTSFAQAELPTWLELLRQRVYIFALDYDAILTAMYALPTSADSACYLCVLPDPGIEPVALGAGETTALGDGEASAPGAGESALSGTAPAEALYTFTLDSGASRSFFRDSTTLTPLNRPVAVSLADLSGGPVRATSTTVLPCLAIPSGTLSGLYLPSFSTNLVAGSTLQDAGVHQFTPAYERVTHCTYAQTGHHMATFTRQPESGLYTLTTESPPVAASASASGQLSAPCSCRTLSHRMVLWHHRLGHPSMQCLCGMHSRYLVSGLPRVLPPLPPSPAPPCLPCVEGRQRAAPHSSSFPPRSAPLQTLHMDVWGPARVSGQDRERYFLMVVDDYSRYTTVFPLRAKGERGGGFPPTFCRAFVVGRAFARRSRFRPLRSRMGLVMEVARTSIVHAAAPHFLWPFAVHYAGHQLNLWPRVSLPETSPTLWCTGEVGDVSVFRVWGSRAFVRDTTADKLSARAVPCVFLGFVPDAPGWQFYHPTSRRVFPSQDVMFDESVPFYYLFPYHTAPLPPPPLFLTPGAPQVDPPLAPGPAPSGVSQVDPPPLPAPVEVTGDSGPTEGGPTRGAASRGAETGGAEPGGAEPGGAEPAGAEPGGAEFGGAEPGGTESGGAAPGGAEASGEQSPWSGRLRSRSIGASPLHSRPRLPLSTQQLHEWYVSRQGRAAGAGGPAAGGAGVGGTGAGTVPLSPQQLREWYASRQGRAAGARGPAARGAGAGDSATGVVSTRVLGAAGPGGARTGCTGAAGTGGPAGPGGAAAGAGTGGSGAVGGVGAGGAGAGGSGAVVRAGTGGYGAVGGAGDGGAGAGGFGAVGGAGAGGSGAGGSGAAAVAGAGSFGDAGGAGATGAGGAVPPRLFFAPPSPLSLPPPGSVLRQVLSLPSSTGLPLQPGSPLPAPSPYTELTGGLTERREPVSCPVSSVRTGLVGRRVPRERPATIPGTHLMALRPSSALQCVPLPSPPESSLPVVADPASDRALVELVDFAAACRLDYAASLVAESESVCPPSIGGECALGTDVLEDRQKDLECLAAAAPHLVSMLLAPEGDPDAPDIPTPCSYAEAIAGEYSSQWQTAMDAEMASWKSTDTYVDEVPLPGANIVSGMWIFRVKRLPGSPPVFKARYVARGFSQREGVDFFHTFIPTPKMTTLRVLLHVAAQRDYELHSLDFSTDFLQGSLHEEIWLRRPPGFTGLFPPGTQWSLRRLVYGLRQAPREWHDTLRTTLAALGFAPSTADPSLFLRTDTSLPPFYILVYVDDLVFATADTEALTLVKSELQKRHTSTDLGELRSYLGLQITLDRARCTITLTQSHMVQQVLQRFGFTWSSPQHTPLATGHSLSAPPSDESVEPSGPYPELVGCLMYLMTCTRPDLAYPLGLLACYVAPGRHRKVHMDAAKRVLRYLCSTSGMRLMLGGRSPVVLTGHSDASWAEIYATAMAAQELRWLTYLLTDLGERPRSPPVLYVDNKATIALCQEHRLEHRTKHIALRYFLAQELQ
ncbi:unnamed protein product [Closterium sp. NIES-54]